MKRFRWIMQEAMTLQSANHLFQIYNGNKEF